MRSFAPMQATKWFFIFISIVCFTSACKAPENTARTLRDLQTLKLRVEQSHPTYTFLDLALLDGISQSSLDFISQSFAVEEVSDFARTFPRLAAHFGFLSSPKPDGSVIARFSGSLGGFYRHLGGGALMLTPTHFSVVKPAHLSESTLKTIRARYPKLVKEQRPVWGDDKWEARVYCEEECLCTSKAVGSAVLASEAGAQVLYVHVSPNAGLLKNEWTYHVALLVGDHQGGWSVIDHKLLGDNEPHSLFEWSQAIDPDHRANYEVSPDRKNFLMSRS